MRPPVCCNVDHVRRSVLLPLMATIASLLVGMVRADERPATRAADAEGKPRLLAVRKIWDQAPHSAFGDLIRFKDRWFCTFREGEGHVGGDGRIRVLVSPDGEDWESVALLKEDGVDLRDPKLSITADGRLMIVTGGSVYRGNKRVGMRPRVAFSEDGKKWTEPKAIIDEGEWLWRVTWHEGVAYGVSYRPTDRSTDEEWILTLWSSRDGSVYERIGTLDVPGWPGEVTLRFDRDGTMIALVRRERFGQHGWIGTSRAPYTAWTWKDIGHRLGGPNFIILPDGRMFAGSRSYPEKATTVLAAMTRNSYEPVLTLPSGGDCSYPGMVWHDGVLWFMYYSSHEGKSSIYLAKIALPAK